MEKSLTDIQKQFWALNSIGKNDIAYNIILCTKIIGFLDSNRLKSAWQKLWQVLSSQWSVFIKDKNIPWDFIEMNPNDIEPAVKTLANKGFDLDNDTPVRVLLIKSNKDEYYFVIVVHHILIDLRVKELVSKILSDYYNFGESDVCLVEYNTAVSNDQTIKQQKFWQNYLEASPESLNLPAGRTVRGSFEGKGCTLFRTLPGLLSENINKLDEEGEYQQFIVFLTCYSILLQKLSGQREFFIGVPFPNRLAEGSENMCGPLVNILPLRVNVGSEDSFATLYQYLRKQMLLLHRNQELPFIEFVKYYQAERKKDLPYFLQAGFTREEPFNLKLDGLICESVDIRPEGSQMDFFLTYWGSGSEIKYRCEYNTAAFSEVQIVSALNSFESTIDQFIKNPAEKISKVSILNKDDRRYFIKYYKDNLKSYPVETSLRELLLKSYDAHSAQNSVRDLHRSLSYSAFKAKVLQYAACLQNKIGSSRRVAVAMDASIERIVLIHAVVMSGNTYVPVDIRWPTSRINYILNNSEAVLCVVDKKDADKISDNNKVAYLSEFNSFKGELNNSKIVSCDNFAVLYTSGSTGQPKGVDISIEGIINRLYWMQETFTLDESSRLIHKVPFTFDVSIWEIFWPFLFGASLYIPDPGVHLDDNYLADFIRSEKITYIHFVPSLLRNFLKSVENTDFPDLKGVICSGEALEVPLVTNFHKQLPGKSINNLYGPTEASIDVTAIIDVDENIHDHQIPIGFPIANTRIYILDEDRNICPPFVRGEIAIAGISLAHGYVNNEEQTKKAFIHGNWGWGDETVYLTGDLGYYNQESLVYYNGRKDTQVKINGIRIELSEIEQQIEKLPAVKKAVVIIADYKAENKQIAAYLLVSGITSANKVRADLSSVLPGYMIPQIIYFVENFPVSSNGKIDRNKLKTLYSTKKQDPVEKATGIAGSRRDKILKNMQRNRNIRSRE